MSLIGSLLLPLPQKHIKKNTASKRGIRRMLVTVTVIGSPGPLRLLVDEEDLVATVIQKALRSYAREGRLPVLGSDPNNIILYCANSDSEILSSWEAIGSRGIRNFFLYRKPEDAASPVGNRSGRWKTWMNRSLNFKISSY